ncbi:DNA-binding protein [Fangia hongkongensis]|uniref:DNA-binding protein n=1 Tax=Fangia hongkongensis TaxID=270495 RepID=UPI0003759A5E|nr:DNA-binding protein [Fangia hongkongensis]MBK2124465.1 DNA-binding protein [Fangia hongkongensis]
MARPGLSYDDIVNAINTLIASGNKPTINSIRETIGRGSPTTISKFFKQWKDAQEGQPTPQVETQPQAELEIDIQLPEKEPEQKPVSFEAKVENKAPRPQNTPSSDLNDPIIQALISSSESFSNDILMSMSDEWDVILNESDTEIKVRKLYAALVKEQTRRETAEKIAKEAKVYADVIKEQTTQRISDLRDSLESQIAFLNGQIRQLKRESETHLEYYRTQLEKANLAIAALKKQ